MEDALMRSNTYKPEYVYGVLLVWFVGLFVIAPILHDTQQEEHPRSVPERTEVEESPGIDGADISRSWNITPEDQEVLSVVIWNVESNDCSPEYIASQIAEAEGWDVLCLVEMTDYMTDPKKSRLELFTESAAIGESSTFDCFISKGTRKDRFRMAVIYDVAELEMVSGPKELELQGVDGHGRKPLLATFRHRFTGTEFKVVVNHLRRGNVSQAIVEAEGLRAWGRDLIEPTLCCGDMNNFDWDIPTQKAKVAYEKMTANGIWQWIRPERQITTQASYRYNSILDMHLGNVPFFRCVERAECTIVELPGQSHDPLNPAGFDDTEESADHRPVLLKIKFKGKEVSPLQLTPT